MILEDATFEAYEYYSRDLTSQSHKPIIAACDDCNKPRILKKYSYHALCNSCGYQPIYLKPKDGNKWDDHHIDFARTVSVLCEVHRNFHHGAPFYGLEGLWG